MAKATKPARRPLVAGNWKMNLTHLEAIALVQKIAFSLSEPQLEAVEVVVLPPFTSLRSVQTLVDGDKLLLGYGAQDLSPHPSGAYTGDVGGPMLAKLGCTYVVVGHSERRQHHGEDDATVAAKIAAAYANELVPILCVGELADVRDASGHVAHCCGQLDAALAGLPAEQARSLVIAYEPVWAIGTGKVATPDDAQEMCGEIRTRLAERYSGDLADGVRILYGGSVKAANAAEILARPDVDGALVGGASLDGDEFARICTAADPATARAGSPGR
ncbi:MAG TPA: triose-phosphate isomerase [Mycobacteriales bacterium]|nr:triose-phosphate isomerase [Mycobacteriales bacterium]